MNVKRRAGPPRVAVIAGEESGDILGADLVAELKRRLPGGVELAGVGGPHLAEAGLESLFDPSEIALMGLSAIVAKLPRLLALIGRTARALAAFEPDVLIIIDAPEFTHRVAKRLRARMPGLPVVNYVCPSVWAWRPHRAAHMAAYVDEVLCLLPFEPGALKVLGGPKGTFVGHRLAHDPDILRVRAARRERVAQGLGEGRGAGRTLLLLPGSRTGEINRMLPDMLETARIMLTQGTAGRIMVATLPRHEDRVKLLVSSLAVPVEVTVGHEAKWQAFVEADAALAASGTVILELALADVPCASVYRLDWLASVFLKGMVEAWTSALPNLIADRVVVPDHYERFFRPPYHARLMAGLIDARAPQHAAQMAGFADVQAALMTKRPAAEIAAERVIERMGL